MKAQETLDAELLALAALVSAEAVEIKCADEERLRNGYAPAYGENFKWPSKDLLAKTLQERGLPVNGAFVESRTNPLADSLTGNKS